MDKQILELLTEMHREIKSMKTDVNDLKTEMHNRFDTLEGQLEGIGGQFELTNESRINDVDFIAENLRENFTF